MKKLSSFRFSGVQELSVRDMESFKGGANPLVAAAAGAAAGIGVTGAVAAVAAVAVNAGIYYGIKMVFVSSI